MRVKETMNDYRYFPEPDLTPLVSQKNGLAASAKHYQACHTNCSDKFINQYGLPEYDASVLTDNKEIALYFDALCQHTSNYKAASNWVMGPVKSYLNEQNMPVSLFPVNPEQLAG
jgi:aspartyl-tRNA(Asn)/glutamyl-tRNA(Gln) amidotransferase subunit B